MKIKFTKLHGLGNDYLFIDCINQDLRDVDFSALSEKMSERHFGIGSDGIILVLPSETADFKMRIFNLDGSEAEMCGNGARGFTKFVFDHKLTSKKELEIETLAGIIKPKIIEEENRKAKTIQVDMGEPKLEREQIPMHGKPGQVVNEKFEVDNRLLRITTVSMGNPHAIIFVDSYSEINIPDLGKKIENHDDFPKRTNVEFIRVDNKKEITMKVWERGSGETLACGTGASAAVVASVLNEKTERKVKVHLLGGDLDIEWNKDDNHVYLTGPATEVFTGEYELE